MKNNRILSMLLVTTFTANTFMPAVLATEALVEESQATVPDVELDETVDIPVTEEESTPTPDYSLSEEFLDETEEEKSEAEEEKSEVEEEKSEVEEEKSEVEEEKSEVEEEKSEADTEVETEAEEEKSEVEVEVEVEVEEMPAETDTTPVTTTAPTIANASWGSISDANESDITWTSETVNGTETEVLNMNCKSSGMNYYLTFNDDQQFSLENGGSVTVSFDLWSTEDGSGSLKVYSKDTGTNMDASRLRFQKLVLSSSKSGTVTGTTTSLSYTTCSSGLTEESWSKVSLKYYLDASGGIACDVTVDNDDTQTITSTVSDYTSIYRFGFSTDSSSTGTLKFANFTTDYVEGTASPEVPEGESTVYANLEEDNSLWSLASGIGTLETVDGRGSVLQIVGDTSSSSNTLTFAEAIPLNATSSVKISYDFNSDYGVSGNTIKGGYKLYDNGTESSRIKVEGASVKASTSAVSSYLTVSDAIDSEKWHSVEVEYSVNGNDQVVYTMTVDGTKIITDQVCSSMSTTASLNKMVFFMDSKCTGIAMYDNITVTQTVVAAEEAPDVTLTGMETDLNPDQYSDIDGEKDFQEVKFSAGQVVLANNYEELASEAKITPDMVDPNVVAKIVNTNVTSSSLDISALGALADGDSFTLAFKLYTEGTPSAGIKFYNGSVSGANEVERFRIQGGTLRTSNASTNWTDSGSMSGSSYTAHGKYLNDYWSEIYIYFTKDDSKDADGYLISVYCNGELLVEETLGTTKGYDKITHMALFCDSGTTATSYFDEIVLSAGKAEIPDFEAPVIPELDLELETDTTEIDKLTDVTYYKQWDITKFGSGSYTDANEDGFVDYPEANVYGVGLNGYELKAPTTATKTVNVKDHGIEPWTNDTSKSVYEQNADSAEAISKLIAQSEAGTVLQFEEGTYYFDATDRSTMLNLKSGVSLQGASNGETIFKVFNPNNRTVIIMQGSDVHDFAIRDITFTSYFYGNYPANTKDALGVNSDIAGEYANGIRIDVGSQIEMTGLTFECFKTMAIRLANTQDVRVKGCTFQKATDTGGGGAGYGISIQGSNGVDNFNNAKDSMHNVVEECAFNGPYIRHGILLQYWTHNNLVINNILTGTGYGSIDLHGEDEYLNEICYNQVYSARWGGAIELGNSGAGHDKAGPMNYVHHNYLLGNYRGIDIVFDTDETVIEHNQVLDAPDVLLGAYGSTNYYMQSGIWIDSGERTSIRYNTITGGKVGLLLTKNTGYTYNGEDYGGGTANYTDFYSNTMTGAATPFSISAGTGNTIHDGTSYVTGNYTTAVSTNAYLSGIDMGDVEFLTLFIPEIQSYKAFTTEEKLSLELVPSAKNAKSVTINSTEAKLSVEGEGEANTLTLDLGVNDLEIVVTAEDGTTTKTYNLQVTRLGEGEEIPTLVTSVTVNSGDDMTMILGYDAVELAVSINPDDATDKSLNWEISNESVLNISEKDGKYYAEALEEGTATVTVTSVSNSDANCTIDVTVMGSLPYQPTLDSKAVNLNDSIASYSATTEDGTNVVGNLFDENLGSSWNGLSAVTGTTVTYDNAAKVTVELDDVYTLEAIQLNWNSSNAAVRKGYFEIYVSEDGEAYDLAFQGHSSGLTTLPETYLIGDILDGTVYTVDMSGSDYENNGGMDAKYIMFVGYGNILNTGTSLNSGWNSVAEMTLFGSPITSGDSKPDTTPDSKPDTTPDVEDEDTDTDTDSDSGGSGGSGSGGSSSGGSSSGGSSSGGSSSSGSSSSGSDSDSSDSDSSDSDSSDSDSSDTSTDEVVQSLTVETEIVDGVAQAEVTVEALADLEDDVTKLELNLNTDGDGDGFAVSLDKEALETLVETGVVKVELVSDSGSITMDTSKLPVDETVVLGLVTDSENPANITMTVETAEGNPLSMDSKTALVADVPYVLAEGETAANLVLYDAEGNIMPFCAYQDETFLFAVENSGEYYFAPGKTADFKDTVNHSYQSFIEFAVARDLFTGTSEDTFSPDEGVTRGMTSTVFLKVAQELGGNTNASAQFDDINSSDYYANAVSWAVDAGIFTGTTGQTFEPEADITREQLALTLVKLATALDIDFAKVNSGKYFSDNNQISSWAKDSVALVQEYGLVSGRADGSFGPLDTSSRGEMSIMLQGFIEKALTT